MATKKKLFKRFRIMVICMLTIALVATSITSFTHAWYMFNKTSEGNTIQTGSFSSNVYAFDEDASFYFAFTFFFI